MTGTKVSLSERERTRIRVTQPDIVAGLKGLGIQPGDVLFAHSSLNAFGFVVGGVDAVVNALLQAVGPGGTVALPTFTWGAFHAASGVRFDIAETPCETGAIPETFRRRKGVVRSSHICHSVAASGPASSYAIGNGVSSFGIDSSFDRLYRLNSWNLLLGVSFNSCTALHSAEELERVPYRSYRDFRQSVVVHSDGRTESCRSIEFLRHDGSANDFAKMGTILGNEGVTKCCTIGEARCINARIRDVIDVARRLLKEDPYALSKPAPGNLGDSVKA